MCIVKWGVKVLIMGGGFSPNADNMRDRRKKSMKTMAGRRHRNFLSDATNSNQSRTHTDIAEVGKVSGIKMRIVKWAVKVLFMGERILTQP